MCRGRVTHQHHHHIGLVPPLMVCQLSRSRLVTKIWNFCMKNDEGMEIPDSAYQKADLKITGQF